MAWEGAAASSTSRPPLVGRWPGRARRRVESVAAGRRRPPARHAQDVPGAQRRRAAASTPAQCGQRVLAVAPRQTRASGRRRAVRWGAVWAVTAAPCSQGDGCARGTAPVRAGMPIAQLWAAHTGAAGRRRGAARSQAVHSAAARGAHGSDVWVTSSRAPAAARVHARSAPPAVRQGSRRCLGGEAAQRPRAVQWAWDRLACRSPGHWGRH